ncbi:MAG TPA: calmodulin-binding protein [Thermoguttaceae bacterium]
MSRRIFVLLLCAASILTILNIGDAQAQQAFGRQWGHSYSTQDWNRLYHYPYVYYPQNFWGPDYYRSSDDLYFRYPPEMRVPVYNKQWHNFYPQHQKDAPFSNSEILPFCCGERHTGERYHKGYHFVLDVF